MKIFFFLLVTVLLFSSCQKYGDQIVSTYSSSIGTFRPLDELTRDSITAGYLTIDSAHAGNPEVFPVMVKIVPSRLQKYDLAEKTHRLTTCYIFCGLMLVSILAGLLLSGRWPYAIVAGGLLAVIMGWCACSAIDWAVTKEVELPKWQYDQYEQQPDGFKAFWDENLYK